MKKNVATAKENKPKSKPKPKTQTAKGLWERILLTVENGTANVGLQAASIQPD